MKSLTSTDQSPLQIFVRLGREIFHELKAIMLNFTQCLLGKVLLKAFNFITLPLLTFYITREEMGIYQLIYGGMGIFVEMVTLGTRQYFGVEFFKHRMMYPRMQLMGKNLWVYLRITSLLFIVLFLGLGWKIDHAYLLVCFIVIVQSYLNIFNELYLMTLQFQMKFLRYNLISLFFGAFQVGMVILSVVVLKQHLLGLVLALLLAESLQLFYSFTTSKRFLSILKRIQLREKIQFKSVRDQIKKSIIFVPSTLSFWLLMNIDQWMLGGMSGLESVGLYAFAGKFPLLFDYLLSSSFILVYTPFLYNKLRENFRKSGWNNIVLSLIVLVLSGGVYVVATNSTFLLKPIVAENYHVALEYIPPLIFVACIRLATHLLQLVIRFKNRITFVVWTNVVIAGTNALLNYFWIPKYGIQGCLMATVSSFILMFLMNLVLHILLIRREAKHALARTGSSH